MFFLLVLKNLLNNINSSKYSTLPSEIAILLKRLWSDIDFQCWYKCQRNQLNNSDLYFLKRLTKILADDYILLEQDVLHTRDERERRVTEIRFVLDTGMILFLLFH